MGYMLGAVSIHVDKNALVDDMFCALWERSLIFSIARFEADVKQIFDTHQPVNDSGLP
jgi:hypothetical protein